jgi:hypothetical protein
LVMLTAPVPVNDVYFLFFELVSLVSLVLLEQARFVVTVAILERELSAFRF